MSEIIYAARIKNDQCYVYDTKNGATVRTIAAREAVSAVVNGNILTITFKNGRLKLYQAPVWSMIREIV